MILAMWLLRCFYAEDLEKATLDIGPKLDPKFQKRVPELLRELYAFRKREEAMTAGGCGRLKS